MTQKIKHAVNLFLNGQIRLPILYSHLRRISESPLDRKSEEMLTAVEQVLLLYVDGNWYDHKLFYPLKKAISTPHRRK